MDPKDRVETVAKTKAGAKQEKATSGEESAPGARFSVGQADVDAVIETGLPPRRRWPRT